MTILIVLAALSILGIGAVFWLLKNEQESEKVSLLSDHPHETITSLQPSEEQEPKSSLLEKLASFRKKPSVLKLTEPSAEPVKLSSKPKLSLNFLKNILKKLPFGKKDSEADDLPQITPLPKLTEYFGNEQEDAFDNEPKTGTASLKTSPANKQTVEHEALTQEDEKDIEKEIDLSSELNELKEKYERLDALFTEKSTELENTKESLDNELKNRKEFNKVKDLLEKELKDSKDKTKNVQSECDSIRTESETQKKRVVQLEDKVTRLEKTLLEKEDKIDELIKRLQTFASPSTAATPPIPVPTITPEPEAPQIRVIEPPQEPELPVETAVAQPTEEANDNESSAASSEPDAPSNTNDEPLVQDTEEASDNQPEESFLKLQPDVLSNEDENKQVLQTEKPEPYQPPPPVEKKKIIEIIDPDEESPLGNNNNEHGKE